MRHANRPGGQVTVNMSTDMLDALEQIAHWRDQTTSGIVRDLVEHLVKAYIGTGPARLEDKPRYFGVDKRGRPAGSRNREVIEPEFRFACDALPRKRRATRSWTMKTIDI